MKPDYPMDQQDPREVPVYAQPVGTCGCVGYWTDPEFTGCGLVINCPMHEPRLVNRDGSPFSEPS